MNEKATQQTAEVTNINKLMRELEDVTTKAEGIRDLLGMLSSCAAEGSASLGCFTAGIVLMHALAFDNYNDLQRVFVNLCRAFEKSIQE